MPKITLVSHFYPSHRGGVEIVAGKLANELASAHNFDIDWFASDCDPTPDNLSNRIHYLPQPCWNGLEKQLGIPWPMWTPKSYLQLWHSIKKADVVHVHDFIYLGNLAAICTAKLLRKPVLITQHIGWIPYQNSAARMLLSLVNRTIGAVTLKLSSQVVFISVGVSSYFSKFVFWKHSPIYIPNGTDIEIFNAVSTSEREQIRNELGVTGEQMVLVFVGRFVEKKGMHVLKKIAAQTPGVYWIFCGSGDLNPTLWQLPNTHVHEGLSGASLARIYRAADLLVLPSRGEGFPLVVQESMACGTPALVSSETANSCPAAMAFLLHEPCSGSHDEVHWLRRITTLKEQLRVLQETRPAIADFAKANWNWQICAQRYGDILKSLILNK